MRRHAQIADAYLRRLIGATGSNTLLKARVTKTGRLLDCVRLSVVSADLPAHLLRAIIEGGRPVAINLRLLSRNGKSVEKAEEHLPLFGSQNRQSPQEQRLDEGHRQLYDMLD